MNFALYLTESTPDNISVDDFIKSIKEKGLYGYDVMKHFDSEDELRSKIIDDAYFNKNEKTKDDSDSVTDDSEKKNDGKKDDKLSEMVIRKDGKTASDVNTTDDKLSLAVRLGLKKQIGADDSQEDDKNKQHVFGVKPQDKEQDKPTPKTFADKMREYAEQRKREQQERLKKDQELRDQRAKEAEERAKQNVADKPDLTFNGVSKTEIDNKSNKVVDRSLEDIEKELEREMFKKTRASTKVDDQGYKRVNNLSRISDADAERKLAKEMEKKFPSKEIPDEKKAKLGNSDQAVEKEEHVMARNEYSKRTLLALADKIPDFTIYCKYRKLNGNIRTGQFTLLGTTSQVTKKQDTLVVIDNDLSKKENKRVYRTINLFKILEIKPL